LHSAIAHPQNVGGQHYLSEGSRKVIDTKPARSRWFQFSLRTLLMLMLLAGAYFAGFATSQKLAEKEIQDASDSAAAEMEAAQRAAVDAQARAALAEQVARYQALQAATQAAASRSASNEKANE
jgi:hypothetical protein